MSDRFKDWEPPIMIHGISTKYNWIAYYPQNITIGYKVDIGAFTLLFGHYEIELQDDVQLGARCTLYTYNTEEESKPKERQNPNLVKGKITIQKGALIGAHSIIFPNVVIEEYEEIPAGSIVYINRKGDRVIK